MADTSEKSSPSVEKLDSENRKGSDTSEKLSVTEDLVSKRDEATGKKDLGKVEEKKAAEKKSGVKVKEEKVEEKTGSTKKEDVKSDGKKEEEKKPVVKKKEIKKKDFAVARGISMKISPKQCIYICRVLMGKSPDAAIARLEAVISEKRVIPMAALEVGHKRGRGLAGGKFPKNACKEIIGVIKQAGANAVVNGIENPVIVIARSDRASAPFRKAGRKAKRAHVYIEVREKAVKVKAKKEATLISVPQKSEVGGKK